MAPVQSPPPQSCSVAAAEQELMKQSAVPFGLVDLMRDLARQIFYHKPKNVELFLAEYLERRLLKEQEKVAPTGDGCVNILGESMAADGTWQTNLLQNVQVRAGNCEKGAESVVTTTFDDVGRKVVEQQTIEDGSNLGGSVEPASSGGCVDTTGATSTRGGPTSGQTEQNPVAVAAGQNGANQGQENSSALVSSGGPQQSGDPQQSANQSSKIEKSGGDTAVVAPTTAEVAPAQTAAPRSQNGATNNTGGWQSSTSSAAPSTAEWSSAVERFFSARLNGGPRPGTPNFYILLGVSALLGLAGVYFLIRSFDVDNSNSFSGGWVPRICGRGSVPHRYSVSDAGITRRFG